MTKLTVDKKLIKDLAKILQDSGLTEIEWSEGDVRLRVARGSSVTHVASVVPAATASAPAVAAETAPAVGAVPAGAVKSPMVGTAYLAPEPGAAVFVRVGDTVSEGQTLMIVEAMKTMNPIPAPRAGRVARILVDNGQPVEFDQPLIVLD